MISGTTPQPVQTFKTKAEEYMDDEIGARDIKNIIEDDFDSVVKKQLTSPTNQKVVAVCVKANAETEVILWRGLYGKDVEDMKGYSCARGVKRDATIAKPDTAASKHQAQKGKSLPEFTTNTDLSFSFKHWLVVVAIKAKYLTQASSSEDGWVCNPEAPLRLLAVVDRTLGFKEKDDEKNAS